MLGATVGLALALLIVGVLIVGYVVVASSLPAPEELQSRASQFASTLIYDREDHLLNEQADPEHGRRTVVELAGISPYLLDATIATEDPNFYENVGVDPVGIARAFYYAVKQRSLEGPGGSTITQQLVKLTFLSPEKTVTRKLKEAILATEITRRYSKETILQIYLNEIPYGNLAYGIEAAAETYFGIPAASLSLAQASMLAGLPQAPSYYDPYTRMWEANGDPGPVKRRQGVVLGYMVERGYITSEQADAAWQESLTLKPLEQSYVMNSPHFVQYVRTEVERVLGPEMMSKGGLRIHTTLDPRIQAIAEEEVSAQVAQLGGEGAGNGALVALRPATGEILAMVGSADFYSEAISGQINMSVEPRQPGSSIKPFTYLAAFEMAGAAGYSEETGVIEPDGYWTPATAIMDITTQFPDGANPPFVPGNYDGKEHGLVSVRSALANSYNIPAVKALEHIGLDRLKDAASRAGITTFNRDDYGLSLTLGGGDVTLLELAGAYGTLANEGRAIPASPVGCIVDSADEVIWLSSGYETIEACRIAEAHKRGTLAVSPATLQQVFNPQHVYLITSILSDLEARRPAFGSSAESLSLPDRASAAKTGTTNDYRDAWTLGYTPDLVVGAWIGNADYTPMNGMSGARSAAPIWHNVMVRSLEGTPAAAFAEPAGIVHLTVCVDSGTLPSVACQKQREEVFASGQLPPDAEHDLWQRVRIDRVTGRIATAFTPADRIEERDMLIMPPKYREWAEGNGFPQPGADTASYAFSPELALQSPTDGSVLEGDFIIYGRVRVPDPLVWRLEYGVGSDPQGWGVLAGPAQEEVDGEMARWDSAAMVERHGVNDYTLRLAAYDAANLDYPVAVSEPVHLEVRAPVSTATPSPTASPSTTPTEMITPTVSVTPSPWGQSTVEPSSTPSPIESPVATSTPVPDSNLEPTVTPEPSATVPVAVRAVLIEPQAGAQVTGNVDVLGIADGPGFGGYRLFYSTGSESDSATWVPIGDVQITPVSGGSLGVWATESLDPGAYRLLLVVGELSGTQHQVQTTVEVVAP